MSELLKELPQVRVKFLSRCRKTDWSLHLPASKSSMKNCYFIFDPEERNYDWLVVYDELPQKNDGFKHRGVEELACCSNNTLLITTEPPTIKHYHRYYTNQFKWVLTSHDEDQLPHHGRIYSQPGLRWFYKRCFNDSIETLHERSCLIKNKVISTITSNKRQRHTLHNKRYLFIMELKKLIPDLEVFGRGVRPVVDKSEVIDSYKYHIVIENFIGEHHWTEKLSDSFLGKTLPFYSGCPNLCEYFHPLSFIPINLDDCKSAARKIKNAINNNEFEKRIEYINQSREKIINEYNIFAMISKIINERHSNGDTVRGKKIKCRRLLRSNPLVALDHFFNSFSKKLRLKTNFACLKKQSN